MHEVLGKLKLKTSFFAGQFSHNSHKMYNQITFYGIDTYISAILQCHKGQPSQQPQFCAKKSTLKII